MTHCPSFRDWCASALPGAHFLSTTWPMTILPTDTELRRILTDVKTIAIVGWSPKPVRASNFVGRYLHMRDYNVIAVNPGAAGTQAYGNPVYAGLDDIPTDIQLDMIDIFRRPEAVPDIVTAALARKLLPSVIWMQFGITSARGRALAEAEGLDVIEDRCPKVEYQRLFGELRKMGFNTGIISSRL